MPRRKKPTKPPRPSSLWDCQHVRHQGITEKEERDRDERYVEALAEQVSRWAVQSYVTLTFKMPHSVESAMRAAKSWVNSLRCLGPHDDLFALLVPERGTAGGHVHVEIVLGGLLPRHIPPAYRPFELEWLLQRIGHGCRRPGRPAGFTRLGPKWKYGRISAEKPRSRRCVALYVTKGAHHGDWEIIGRPLRRRKRKQKPKRGDDGRQRSK